MSDECPCEQCQPVCISCGVSGDHVRWFANLYRRKELKAGRLDPGLLCGKCAGSRDGNRIGSQIATLSTETPADV